MKNKLHNQRGNVFIYILIAIALLAALSYAVSRGSRSSGSALTGEQARIAAQEIIDYGNDIATAVQKLTLRGCSDTEISFDSAVLAGYSNVSSPTDESCNVFSENGGRLNVQEFSESFFETSHSAYNAYGEVYFSNTIQVENIGTTCGTADCTDLLFQLPHIRSEICEAINVNVIDDKILPDESVTNHSYQTITKFIGAYTFQTPGTTSTIGDDSFPAGRVNGCIHRFDGGGFGTPYTYFQVLIAR